MHHSDRVCYIGDNEVYSQLCPSKKCGFSLHWVSRFSKKKKKKKKLDVYNMREIKIQNKLNVQLCVCSILGV